MYRKHLKEMENKSGSKAIDRIAEIPIVNTALTNVNDYYGKMKQTNALLRTTCNLAELSLKTMAFAATPITSICKKPIESVDSYFYEKVDALEFAFPVLSKPTDVLTNQAKEMYDKKVKQPIEQFYIEKDRKVDELKTFGTNKVNSVVKAGTDSLDLWCHYSYDMVDKILENRFAKILTEPMLNLTEKSLNYWIPSQSNEETDDHRTLRRIYDINSRLYNHLYQTTFTQLNRLHFQFENIIQRLQMIKQIMDMVYTESKDRLIGAFKAATDNSLVKQCATIIEKKNISLERMESIAKGYFNAILTNVTHILEKYMKLVQNFPVGFNGSRLKQVIENLRSQIYPESFSVYLNSTIDNLKNIHHALLGYTQQMFQVVNDSKLMQLLNAKSVEFKSELPNQQPEKSSNANNNNNYNKSNESNKSGATSNNINSNSNTKISQ
jgi:hypothetical protein